MPFYYYYIIYQIDLTFKNQGIYLLLIINLNQNNKLLILFLDN